jgi:hypothetical protein
MRLSRCKARCKARCERPCWGFEFAVTQGNRHLPLKAGCRLFPPPRQPTVTVEYTYV